jgi:hypothetical protein
MATAEILVADAAQPVPRHKVVWRTAGSVVLGVIVGLFLSAALQVGLLFHFPEDRVSSPWGVFFWGQHWALRVAASWTATIGVGYVTGMVARQRGRTLAIIAVLPSFLCWLALAAVAWRGRFPFIAEALDVDISIGNKLAASVLVLTALPFAAWAGNIGEQEGQVYGPHFDDRRFSLLGIKWYHYFWLPFLVYLWIVQASWAAFYGFVWMKLTWKSGESLLSFVPMVFTVMIWGTLVIMGQGAAKAYQVLAGFDPIPTARSRAYAVLKNGVGLLVLAAILQVVIGLLHLGLVKLLGHGG